MAFVKPVVEHWLELEITKWVHQETSIRLSIAPQVDAVPRSYISLHG